MPKWPLKTNQIVDILSA